MQYMPANFMVGWDALATLPPSQVGKLFAKAVAAETRAAVATVSITDVLKALAKADAVVDPKGVQSIVAVIRLLATDIFNLQITDSSALRKKLGKQISKQRELGEADEALFEAIGEALSEETVAPTEVPAAAVGGCANVVSVTDAGLETNLVSGKQRLYVSATVVDASRYGAADASGATLHPTVAEAISLVTSTA